VRKGPLDLITDGQECLYVKNPGSLKLCGGIGDILAGCIGSFTQYEVRADSGLGVKNTKLESVAMACWVTRRASSLAFAEFKHSLTAPDILRKLPDVICDC
jgi:ATP-dependent NAD(P)H-hydrate dehydratase